MSTHRCNNYKKITGTILLDEEEALLRNANVRTKAEVESFWDARYPHARPTAKKTVTEELFRRLGV